MSRKTNDAQHPETPLAPAAASASAPASSLELRARAEARLVARGKLPAASLTREAGQQLIHELSVHQIELEIQNEELRRAQTELEASRTRYFELYDLAPVSYVALNDGGLITEANLAAARLLNLSRHDLLNQRLSNWIKPDDQDIFYLCRRQLKATAPQQQCELHLERPDGSSLWVALSLSLQPEHENSSHCLVVLTNIDAQKQLDALRSQIEEDMLNLNAELDERVQTRTAELEQTASCLHQAEERFRYAMDASRDGLFDWQVTTDDVYFSPGYARMLGYEPGELPPNISTWLNLMPPEQRDSMEASAQRQCLSPSGTITLEHQLRTKTGGYRWILGRGKVVQRAADGTPIRVVGTHVDITEIREARAALEAKREELEVQVSARTAELRIQTERLRLATEAGNVGIWSWNPDSGAVVWDPQVFKIHGMNREEVTPSAETWKQWVRPQEISRLMVHIRRVLKGTHPLFCMVFRIRTRDDQERYVAARGRLMPQTTEGERLLLGVIWDVTAEQHHTAALRASEAKAHAVINASPVPLAITHNNDSVSHLNPAFVATFGYDLNAIPTWSHWWSLTIPEPAERARILAMLRQRLTTIARATHPSDPLEIKVRCQDGRKATVVIRVTVLSDDQRLNTLYDITELTQAREAAQQAARAKSDFLSHMSHEIRTPLNAALGMTEVLERTQLDAEQFQLVRQVRIAGHSLLEILNDILDISRIEAGALPLEQRPFALPSVLNALEALLSGTSHQKQIRLVISAPPAIEGSLLGDARRLKQILINLVGNAIKFTKHGEVQVVISLLEETSEQVRLRFEVVDTGIGIPPEILVNLFEAFVQGSIGVTRRFGGTGLGLAICKHLTEALGGTIGAESLPGIGSLFWFDLPFERTTDAPEEPEPLALSASASTGEPRLDGARLLLVDDSAMNREVGERLLALEGARVTLAADGRKALALLSSGPRDFDAVLMDVQMPELDGLTATRRIRRELGLTELPIVALTAGVLPAQQAAAREAGMNAVLIKPLDTDRMVATLRQCMGLEPSSASRSPPLSAKAAESFPDIPGIDRHRVTQIMGGNSALFDKLLARFAADCPNLLADTRAALTSGDRALASRLMHSLRGNASILGASEIIEVAKTLEDAIEAGETNLDHPLEALAKQLAPLIEASTARHSMQPATKLQVTAASQKASEPLNAEVKPLRILRAVLSVNNLDALTYFDQLRPELNNILGETRTETLGHQISDLRFTEALTLLESSINEEAAPDMERKPS